MPTEVVVTRSLFFEDGPTGGMLRFEERSPPETEHQRKGPLCGCTSDVLERPAGAPRSVRSVIEFQRKVGERDVRLRIESEWAQFWIRWPGAGPEQEHAYFWFNGRGDRMKVEVTGTGVGPIGCTLTDACFGADVDTSRMYNGHSPSRVVPAGLGPDDVWVHDCSFGTEAVEVLPRGSAEVAAWRDLRRSTLRARDRVALGLATEPVERTREAALADPDLISWFEAMSSWLVEVLQRGRGGVMLDACARVHEGALAGL